MDEAKTTQSEVPAAFLEFFGNLIDRLKGDKLTRAYGNNVRFEPSVWDLKILFGQLEQHTGTPEVTMHTAVTIPWATAKVLEYYVRANVAYCEKTFGPIKVPEFAVPAIPEAPSEEVTQSQPDALELWRIYKDIHAEVFGPPTNA